MVARQLDKHNDLTCRQSRAGSTSLDCFVSKARRKGRITSSASEPSRVCPASAKVAAAACPVLGLAGDETGLGSTDLTSASASASASVGVDGSPSDSVSWTTDLHPELAHQQKNCNNIALPITNKNNKTAMTLP